MHLIGLRPSHEPQLLPFGVYMLRRVSQICVTQPAVNRRTLRLFALLSKPDLDLVGYWQPTKI